MQEQVSARGDSNAKIEGVRMSEEDSCSEGVCVGVGGGSYSVWNGKWGNELFVP